MTRGMSEILSPERIHVNRVVHGGRQRTPFDSVMNCQLVGRKIREQWESQSTHHEQMVTIAAVRRTSEARSGRQETRA